MNPNPAPPSRWRSPVGVFFMLVAGVVGVYYLLTEHLTHVTQAIHHPFLGLLLSPVVAAAAMALASGSVTSNALCLRTANVE